jgi:hypothetical protein
MSDQKVNSSLNALSQTNTPPTVEQRPPLILSLVLEVSKGGISSASMLTVPADRTKTISMLRALVSPNSKTLAPPSNENLTRDLKKYRATEMPDSKTPLLR